MSEPETDSSEGWPEFVVGGWFLAAVFLAAYILGGWEAIRAPYDLTIRSFAATRASVAAEYGAWAARALRVLQWLSVGWLALVTWVWYGVSDDHRPALHAIRNLAIAAGIAVFPVSLFWLFGAR